MNKHVYCLITTVLFIVSCNLLPEKKTGAPENPGNEVAPGPPSSELLDALEGRWQDQQDGSNVIEISDDLLVRYRGNTVLEEEKIAVFADCVGSACRIDSITATEGWCFTEFRKSGQHCNLVLNCDTALLIYRPLDGSETVFRFKKM